MKTYLIYITVDVPYPKTYEFRESASNVAPAVSRALKNLRKTEDHRCNKRIKEYRIRAMKLN